MNSIKDDLSIPEETVLVKSTSVAVMWSVLIALWGAITISLVRGAGFAFISCVVLFYLLWITIILLINGVFSKHKKPQIVLSNEGIDTIGNGLTKWSDITDEEVSFHSRATGGNNMLTYNTPNGTVEFSIDNIKVLSKDLSHLLSVYRQRSLHESQK